MRLIEVINRNFSAIMLQINVSGISTNDVLQDYNFNRFATKIKKIKQRFATKIIRIN